MSAGTVARQGVFVTGTDTGIGKTLVAACLAVAWQASYWKPLQTGIGDEPGDTETVVRLGASRIVPPSHQFRAPLSPQAAAACEGAVIDAGSLRLPAGEGPLVVEGAGGLMVPINDETMMIDLIGRFALPAVLVARGTLGTINHTLLSLEALRARGIPVAGVVLSGPVVAGNRDAIAGRGAVRIIAELPWTDDPDAEDVARLSRLIRPLADVLAGCGY